MPRFIPTITLILTIASILTACATNNLNTTTIPSSNVSCSENRQYSVLKNACVPVFYMADITIATPHTPNQPIYGILSEDGLLAEIFLPNQRHSLLMDSIKGGYVSKDGTVRLLYTQTGWQLRHK